MRNPSTILKALSEKAVDKNYKFKRLYRNLYNPDFYLQAYKNIYSTNGSMTAGADGTTLSGMSLERIDKIINSLKDHSYQPKPARRTYIEKKNSTKKRPLGIPSSDDKLVQEVVKMILESIYEPNFSKYSHGFRPSKSCHTALNQITVEFTGAKWFIEGDIKACFDSFDHHVLINLLRKRIEDEYFISLMWKFLKAGYMEQWVYNKTYAGTPQGSGVSPILANIYLSELDDFVADYTKKFDKGKTARNGCTEYRTVSARYYRAKDKYKKVWDILEKQEKHEAIKIVKAKNLETLKTPWIKPFDESYKRLKYCRYADDWIISVNGSKSDAEQIKADIKAFLTDVLKLELSEEKTKITKSTEFARFLGYDIAIARSLRIKRRSDGALIRIGGKILLHMPKEKWVNKLKEYEAFKIVKDENGKEKWKAVHRGWLMSKCDIDILNKYNSEIRGLYNYYCLAINVSRLDSFYAIMKYSMQKTFAGKYKCKTSVIRKRYCINGEFAVKYETKYGSKTCFLYNRGFKRKKNEVIENAEILPQYYRYIGSNTLAYRLKLGICEYCGVHTDNILMHQVKKLKDLKGALPWESLMIEKRRKTLAVCKICYDEINEISLKV